MLKEIIKKLEQSVREDYGNTTGILVHKDGKAIYEAYFNGFRCGQCRASILVTKSIFSILIGIAIDRGEIKRVWTRGFWRFSRSI